MDQIMSQIIGYTFKAENYTPAGVLEAIYADERFDGWRDMSQPPMSVEDNLNEVAWAFGIDREDETSFDSGDFPKVITSDMDLQDLILTDEFGDSHLYEDDDFQ